MLRRSLISWLAFMCIVKFAVGICEWKNSEVWFTSVAVVQTRMMMMTQEAVKHPETANV